MGIRSSISKKKIISDEKGSYRDFRKVKKKIEFRKRMKNFQVSKSQSDRFLKG